MKAPFIFMNTDSEYFYIFPDVFFSKFAPCEGFSNKNISGERFKIRTIREQEEIGIFYPQKGRACSTRLLLDRLTPSELFYYINYTMS